MRLTKQYAYALLNSVSEDEAVSIYYELKRMTEIFKQAPDYVSVLEFQPEEFKTVRDLLTDDLDEKTLNLLEVLAQDRLLSQLETVAEDYRLVLIEENLLFNVKVYSAKPLEESKKEDILKMVESRWGNNYTTEFVVEKNILGGIRLEINGAVIDTTFRSRIDQIIREVRNGSKR